MINQAILPFINNVLHSLGRYYAVSMQFLITVILTLRLLKEKKETGNINYVRFIILCVFASVFWMNIWEVLGFEVPFVPLEVSGFNASDFSPYNFGLGLAVSLGLVLAAYINQFKKFYFTSLFIFFGLFILYIYTGLTTGNPTSIILMPYVYITGSIVLVFQLYTGFNLKDNGALGIGIYFLLAFITIFIPNEGIIGIFDALLSLIYLTFGLIFAMGYFKPFKEHGDN